MPLEPMPLTPDQIEVPDPEMIRILREKTGPERLEILYEMVASARRLIRASVISSHPEWSEDEVEREVARRFARGG